MTAPCRATPRRPENRALAELLDRRKFDEDARERERLIAYGRRWSIEHAAMTAPAASKPRPRLWLAVILAVLAYLLAWGVLGA